MASAQSVHVRPSGVDPHGTIDLLRRWLAGVANAPALAWLDSELDRQRAGLDEQRLAIALGSVRRRLGKHALALSAEDIAQADAWRSGWQPQLWGTDEAARVALLLATDRNDNGAFSARVDKLCATAEINELIAYLKGFAVFPAPQALHARAREAARSSATPVFQAIACNNPYPFDYFDQPAWNQVVIKCIFVGAELESIVGLRARRNPELLAMLRDFVAERHAAGRPLPDNVHRFIAE